MPQEQTYYGENTETESWGTLRSQEMVLFNMDRSGVKRRSGNTIGSASIHWLHIDLAVGLHSSRIHSVTRTKYGIRQWGRR